MSNTIDVGQGDLAAQLRRQAASGMSVMMYRPEIEAVAEELERISHEAEVNKGKVTALEAELKLALDQIPVDDAE